MFEKRPAGTASQKQGSVLPRRVPSSTPATSARAALHRARI